MLARARGGGSQLNPPATITSTFSTSNTSGADVTGLSYQFVAGGRPIAIAFGCSGVTNTVTANAFATIQEGVGVLNNIRFGGVANGVWPGPICVVPPATYSVGTHTVKVVLIAGTAGSATIQAAATAPAWLFAWEV